VRRNHGKIKLLANDDLATAVTVRGVKMSAAARDKIVAAGGKVEE
jgi:ribosomal protein L15